MELCDDKQGECDKKPASVIILGGELAPEEAAAMLEYAKAKFPARFAEKI